MAIPLAVLIVEDSESDAQLVVRLLEKTGYQISYEQVETAVQMRAALEKQAWDIVVSDYSLPEFNGHAALMLLQEMRLDAPFIVVSGTMGEETAVAMMRAGAHDYLMKGNLARLAPAVERELSQAEARRERRKAEAALRQSEERFRQIAENIAEVFWMSDPELTKILYVSPAYEIIWGRTCQSLYDRPISFAEAIHPDDFEQAMKELEKQKVGEGFDHEYRIVRPDGSIRWIWDRGFPIPDQAGEVVRIAGIAQDITERKRAEECQEAQYAVTRVLAEATTLKEAAPKILQVLCETLRWELGEIWAVDRQIKALRCVDLWHRPEFSAPDFEEAARSLDLPSGVGLPGTVWATGQPTWISDFHENPDFPHAPVAAKAGLHGALAIPILSGKETMGVINFFSMEIRKPDLLHLQMLSSLATQIGQFVERKQSEEAKGELERQLLQSQKMEAIGQLAGGVAHDFNNTLMAISGYSELMLLQLPVEHPLRRIALEILKGSDQGANLTRQLLAFSRRRALTPKVLDLNKSILDMESMLRRLIGEDVDLSTVFARNLGFVKADPGQIEQVLMNLAVNARDAMLRGGKLTIETCNVEFDEEYAGKHLEVKAGDYVLLAVSDTGSGMTEDIVSHIFEPFFTTKEEGKGTGLGLSTVYGIVKQSGGHISVYSHPGHGTTFKVYFPRLDAKGEMHQPAQSAAEEIMSHGEVILLVDDNESIREAMGQFLELKGYRVLPAGHGNDALEVARNHPGQIDMLISDVVMPGMSGRELSRLLTEERPKLKTLYMSGYTEDAIARNGILDASTAFIQKPVRMQALLAKIAEVLRLEDGKK